MLSRAMVEQQKTHQPVQFEIAKLTRDAVSDWIEHDMLKHENYLFPSRIKSSFHLSTRRTEASLIYKRTKNLRAVQLLLGHTKLESTVRYLGIEVDDALEMAEQTEV